MSLARRLQGFTLIEVLVALGIVAIALAAGAQATGALTLNARRQSDFLLAQICAENELVKARLSRQMPSVGDSTEPCAQAARKNIPLTVFASSISAGLVQAQPILARACAAEAASAWRRPGSRRR